MLSPNADTLPGAEEGSGYAQLHPPPWDPSLFVLPSTRSCSPSPWHRNPIASDPATRVAAKSALTHQGCPRNCFVALRRHSRDEFGPVGWPRPSSREVTVHDRGWDDVRSGGCCKPPPR